MGPNLDEAVKSPFDEVLIVLKLLGRGSWIGGIRPRIALERSSRHFSISIYHQVWEKHPSIEIKCNEDKNPLESDCGTKRNMQHLEVDLKERQYGKIGNMHYKCAKQA